MIQTHQDCRELQLYAISDTVPAADTAAAAFTDVPMDAPVDTVVTAPVTPAAAPDAPARLGVLQHLKAGFSTGTSLSGVALSKMGILRSPAQRELGTQLGRVGQVAGFLGTTAAAEWFAYARLHDCAAGNHSDAHYKLGKAAMIGTNFVPLLPVAGAAVLGTTLALGGVAARTRPTDANLDPTAPAPAVPGFFRTAGSSAYHQLAAVAEPGVMLLNKAPWGKGLTPQQRRGVDYFAKACVAGGYFGAMGYLAFKGMFSYNCGTYNKFINRDSRVDAGIADLFQFSSMPAAPALQLTGAVVMAGLGTQLAGLGSRAWSAWSRKPAAEAPATAPAADIV